jgi:hypothetical protein
MDDYTQQQQLAIRDSNASITPQFHNAVFGVGLKFCARDFLKFDSEGKIIGVKNDGKITVSTAAGTLHRLSCDHPEDFARADEALKSVFSSLVDGGGSGAMSLNGHHHRKKNKKYDESGAAGGRLAKYDWDRMSALSSSSSTGALTAYGNNKDYGDIVAAINMECVTSDYPRMLDVSFPGVNKHISEGFTTPFVSISFIPNKLHATKPQNFSVCNRNITSNKLEFMKRYPRTTVASLDQDLSPPTLDARTGLQMVYVNWNSAMFGVYHMEKYGNQPIKEASHQHTCQHLMTLADATKWRDIAKQELASNMCFGDVTGNFGVVLEPTKEFFREIDHALFLKNSANGVQFLGFGDQHLAHHGVSGEMNNSYLDKYYSFNSEFHVSYLPGRQGY